MGGKSNNIIELNGQRFDAVTGKKLGGHSKAVAKKSVDGFLAVANASASAGHNIKRAGRQPEKSKTLRRDGLAKPAKSKIKLSQGQLKSSDSLVAATAMLLDTRASKKDLAAARRASLAEQITQHPKVRHFADSVATYAGPKAAGFGISLPKHKPAPKTAAPKTPQTDSRARLQSMINSGLAKAKSHEQPRPSVKIRKQNRTFYAKRGIALVILLIVFAALYIFRAPIELQLAGWRAGVNAELPGYVPAGYKFDGPVHSSSGAVAFNYKNGNRMITIDQENSSWDSQTLLDSIVAPTGAAYQTASDGGRTIYFYANGKATWVNDGIWYLISASPSVGNPQLQKIVDSM